MSRREALYLRLPIPLQHLACSLEGWRIQRTRYGGDFLELLREYESRTFWPVEQIRIYRDRRLRAFIDHCARTVPFYRRRFKELGISVRDIRSLEDLRALPILTKDEVQRRYPELVSKAVPEHQQLLVHTSGTTGAGLRFVTTLRAEQEQWASWWRYRRWHGLQLDTWCGYFGGRSVVPLSQSAPPFWRYNYPARQILFSAYHLNSTNLGAYVQELRRKRPPWLHGYPSLMALLAAYVIEKGVDLGYQVKWITAGAENLLPQQAALIERAFGVRPRQNYGLREAVANFSECEHGALHVDEDFAAVEFIPNPDGAGYRIIGTNFTNLATPLIRYDAQDVVTLGGTECSCGRPGRTVTRVDGRKEDYVVLGNGSRLGRLDHIFKDLIHIQEAQIYQRRPGEITIRIVRGLNYTDRDEKALLEETRKRVGDETLVSIEYVEKLPRSQAGKLRLVVSEIPEGQLENVLK